MNFGNYEDSLKNFYTWCYHYCDNNMRYYFLEPLKIISTKYPDLRPRASLLMWFVKYSWDVECEHQDKKLNEPTLESFYYYFKDKKLLKVQAKIFTVSFMRYMRVFPNIHTRTFISDLADIVYKYEEFLGKRNILLRWSHESKLTILRKIANQES